jgi:hypothetical protein
VQRIIAARQSESALMVMRMSENGDQRQRQVAAYAIAGDVVRTCTMASATPDAFCLSGILS